MLSVGVGGQNRFKKLYIYHQATIHVGLCGAQNMRCLDMRFKYIYVAASALLHLRPQPFVNVQ